MYEGQEGADYGKNAYCKQKDAAWSEYTSEVHTKWADKHDRSVIGTVEPGAGIIADAEMTFQVRQPQAKHAAGKCDESGSDDHAQYSHERSG